MPAELDSLHPVVLISSYVKMLTEAGDSDPAHVLSRGDCLETPHGTCLLVAGLQLCDLITLDDCNDGAGAGAFKSLRKACTGVLGEVQPTLLLLSQKHSFHMQIAPAELIPCKGGWEAALLKDDFKKEGPKFLNQLYGDKILRLVSLPAKPEAMCPLVVIDNLPKFLPAPATGGAAAASASVAAAPASVAGSSTRTDGEGTAEDTMDVDSIHEVS